MLNSFNFKLLFSSLSGQTSAKSPSKVQLDPHLDVKNIAGVKVVDEVKHLSAEHTEYKWLFRKEFIDTIFWYTAKTDLEVLLNKIE